MPRTRYGQTWWGEQWLNALAHIDYSNRIPRGKTYANKGAVKELTIKGNTVRAGVQGTRPAPYRVTVKVPDFSKEAKEELTALIMKDPLLISRLLNRELPSQIHRMSEQRNIRIFPRRWDDLEMKCSCPDWAVPCKHLAAVINVITREIDRNPFVLFRLHGYDIIGELKKRGMEAVEEEVTIPGQELLLAAEEGAGYSGGSVSRRGSVSRGGSASGGGSVSRRGSAAAAGVDPDPGSAAVAGMDSDPGSAAVAGMDSDPGSAAAAGVAPDPGSAADLGQIDFSRIIGQRENLLALVPERPLFWEGDFKALLDKAYKRTARQVGREVLRGSGQQEGSEVNYEKYTGVQIVLRDICSFVGCRLETDRDQVHFTAPGECMEFLRKIPPKQAETLTPGLQLLWYLYRFVVKLAEESAFVPQLIRLEYGRLDVRWNPALIHEPVREIFGVLAGAAPPDLVVVENVSRQQNTSGQKDPSGHQDPSGPLNRSEVLKSLVSIFLREFFRESRFDRTMTEGNVPGMFFGHLTPGFDGLGEAEIPATIQRWTERFFMAQRPFIPVIRILTNGGKDQFALEVAVEDRRDPLKEPVPLKRVMEEDAFRDFRLEVLRILEMLSPKYRVFEQIISTSGRYVPKLTSQEFAGFMFDTLPLIRLYGIRVLLPRELQKLVRPGLTLSVTSSGPAPVRSFLDLEKIIDFRWQIALGEEALDPDDFLRLVQGLSGIVRVRQQYVYLQPSDLRSLMEQVNQQERPGRNQLLQAVVSGEYYGQTIHLDQRARELIASLLEAGPAELPGGLTATLRPYQKRGYDWMYKNAGLGFGSIIADDMGLGKTLQVITLLLKIRQEGARGARQAVVVVPTTLLSNWQKEFEKFAPEVSCTIYHGPGRTLEEGADVVLTSYGVVRSDREMLSRKRWRAVVIDEAQNIKNPGAGQSKAVKSLKGEIRIAMSGTPVENRLSEYWSVFDFINKGYLGPLKDFTEKYAVPIEVERNRKALERFLKITGPFILRRVKSDKSVISDLPDKLVNNYYATLEPDQAALYQQVLETIMEQVENVDVEEKDGRIQRKGLVLKLIMALKQVCNHPSQYLKKEECPPALSGKAGLFLSLLENILGNNEKVLVFTQFREMGMLLQSMIGQEMDRRCLFLHGGTSRKERDIMVEQFQQDPHRKIMILTTKAGGTGLNLTAANHVIHYDLWWNPAVEAQATDRAYRIGQDRNVMVYRLITTGTFEEKINAMLEEKKELASLTVSTGEKWVGELSNRELKELFSMNA